MSELPPPRAEERIYTPAEILSIVKPYALCLAAIAGVALGTIIAN